MDTAPITFARANLTEVITSVRLLGRCVTLTRRDKPQAVLVPADLGPLIEAAGGPERVAQILADYVAPPK